MEFNLQFPIYQQVRDMLRDRLDSGEFLPGTALPPAAQLAKEYGISLVTIRSAIEGLEKEGLVKAKQGKGIFVVGNRVKRDLDKLTGFRQMMRDQDIVPKVNVLDNFSRKAGRKYSSIFKMPEDSLIHYVRRVCFAGELPMSLEGIYVPFDVLPNLAELDKSEFSMYELYDFYKVELSYARQTLDIVQLKKNEANLLDIPVDQSVFLFKCWTYSEKRLIEYAESYVRADLCDYSVHFGNQV